MAKGLDERVQAIVVTGRSEAKRYATNRGIRGMSDGLRGCRVAIRAQIDQLAPIAAGLHRLCPEIIRPHDEFGSPSIKYNRP